MVWLYYKPVTGVGQWARGEDNARRREAYGQPAMPELAMAGGRDGVIGIFA